jgi:DNA-binding NarL/FixJ family response regulator
MIAGSHVAEPQRAEPQSAEPQAAEPQAAEPQAAERLRVLIADDQAVVRLGFTTLIDSQDDMTVAGSAANGELAVRLAAELKPDVVLMDVRMPVMDGIEATRRLAASSTAPHVLVLTTFDLDDYVYAALRAGASGFLLKDASPEEILTAIRVVAAGDALLDPSVTKMMIAEFTGRARLTPPPELDTLTPREMEVLLLIANGLANAEIAAKLFLAEQTVKSHVSSVLLKLRLRDRVQAVILAYESGLVVPGSGTDEAGVR